MPLKTSGATDTANTAKTSSTANARDTDAAVAAYLPLTAITFEILLSLADGERHGYDIMLAIEERTGGRLSLNPGTLYRALDRLSSQGLLENRERRAAGGAGDGPRRFFRLAPLGARVAEAEAGRLADQVRAARRARLLGGKASLR